MTYEKEELDVFICHSSKEKDDIARPLAKELKKRALKVWYDEDSILDSEGINEGINDGLGMSKIGVLILSKNFFRATWAQMELGVFNLKRHNKQGEIFPIFYRISPNHDYIKSLPFLHNIKGPVITENEELNIQNLSNRIFSIVETVREREKNLLKEKSNEKKREIQKIRRRLLVKYAAIFIPLIIIGLIYFFSHTNITTTTPSSPPVSSDGAIDTVNRRDASQPQTNQEEVNKGTEFRKQNHSAAEINPPTHAEAKEDFSKFVNPKEKVDVSVLILDENEKLENSVSSDITKIYKQSGKTGNIGLLKSTFISKPEFKDLCEGNSDIIENLKLGGYTNYLAIGKISYSSQKGNLVNGTIVCTASIEMKIINIASKSVDFFTIEEIGNGVTESQARQQSKEKLLGRYFSDHSSL